MEEKRLNEEEVDLRDYLKVMGKRKWTIIITLLVCLAVAAIFTFSQRPVYQIKSAFDIGSIPIGTVRTPEPILIMTPEATASLCKSDYLLSKVKEILNLPKGEEIKIKVESGSGSSTVTITLDSSSPEKAVKVINTIAEQIDKEQNILYEEKIRPLKNEAEGVKKEIGLVQSRKEELFSRLLYLNQLQTRFDGIQRQIASFERTRISFPAIIPEKPIKPRPVFNLTISIILGLFLGIFLAFSQEYLSKGK